MSENYSVDENGLYYLADGTRMLVSYMRGDYRPVKNPCQSPYEPTLIVEYFPGPVGCTVAFVQNGELKIGFSKANIWSGDRFNKHFGIEGAIKRALYNSAKWPFDKDTVHEDIRDALMRMYFRSKSYFKYTGVSQD